MTNVANPQLMEDNEIVLYNEIGRYIQDDNLNGNLVKRYVDMDCVEN